jgi:hypothetical protein
LPTLHLLATFQRLKSRKQFIAKIVVTLFAAACFHYPAAADDEITGTNTWTPQNSRFGLFNCLDHRSGYYQDSFPQPLLLEDTSLEPDPELELSYLHTAASDLRSDDVSAEVQYSFDLVTFELEVPYERVSDSDDTAQGIGNIELNGRCPVYQYVSANGMFDTTAGVGVEVGIPVNSEVSKNTELEPGVFDDLKFGHHFTIQAMVGYDKLFGGGDDGGSEEFEYGLDFAYALPRAELPIPGVTSISPMFEVAGEVGLNEDESGQNNLLGSIGFRLDFQPIAGLDPSLGLGYVFPMSPAAHEEIHWGIATSFTVEF